MYLIAALTVLLYSSTDQIITYQDLVPRLAWSAETLYLNVRANRGAWLACRNFGVCDLAHPVSYPVAWRGEVRWIV